MVYNFSDGLQIKTKKPKTHSTPGFCPDCKVFYYFNDHFCIENDTKQPMQKRAMKGYYDGQ